MLRAPANHKHSTMRLPLAVLFVVLVGGRIEAADGGGTLRLATCQFPVSADERANGEWVRTQMRQASARGADLIHFPECALSGYAGVDLPSLDKLDWDALHDETEAVLALARELKVWVVLGSTHRLGGEHKPHNCLYVISPEGKVTDRYDKRFCTGGDLKHYSPGMRTWRPTRTLRGSSNPLGTPCPSTPTTSACSTSSTRRCCAS